MHNTVTRCGIAMAIMVMLSCCTANFQQKDSGTKSVNEVGETLSTYLQLRFGNADWKDYSKYITWPDEPSWDCVWVVSHYKIGEPGKEGQKVIVQVVLNRIGLYCYDFNFKPGKQSVKIEYELIKSKDGWRVDSPMPDYPDISASALIRFLQNSASNLEEEQDRREKFNDMASMLSEALERVPSPSEQ